MEFARHTFKLNKPDKSGISEREHLEQVQRQTGRTPEGLIGPELPVLLEPVWRIFIELSNRRQVAFSGVAPIRYEDIESYMNVMQKYISPTEASIIMRLDTEYMKVNNV